MESLKEIDAISWYIYNLPKLNQVETNDLNRPKSPSERETVI